MNDSSVLLALDAVLEARIASDYKLNPYTQDTSVDVPPRLSSSCKQRPTVVVAQDRG
jgi:hypothetical protein